MPTGTVIEYGIVIGGLLIIISLVLVILRKFGFKAKVKGKDGQEITIGGEQPELDPEQAPEAEHEEPKAFGISLIILRKLIAMEIEKALLPQKTLDESRSIVQEGCMASLNIMTRVARETICSQIGGCDDDPDEIREYEIIVEGLRPQMVQIVMQSVERNHFAEQTPEQWSATKQELFGRVFTTAEAYVEARFKSPRVQTKAIREQMKLTTMEFLGVFNTTMDKCLAVSNRSATRYIEIEQEVAAIAA